MCTPFIWSSGGIHCLYIYVRPILEYEDVIWDNCPNYIKEKLEHINYEAARIITGATKLTSIRILLQECGTKKQT
jgi:hypothetical protein